MGFGWGLEASVGGGVRGWWRVVVGAVGGVGEDGVGEGPVLVGALGCGLILGVGGHYDP